MKKFARIYAALLLAAPLATSCYEEVNLQVPEAPASVDKAAVFYENLCTVVESAYLSDGLSETAMSNPVYEKLASLPIVDAEGRSISFFDLPSEERAAFIRAYSVEESAVLKAKLERSNQAGAYIQAQNEVVSSTIEEFEADSKAGLSADRADAFLLALQSRMEKFGWDAAEVPSEGTKANRVSDTTRIKKALVGIAKRGDMNLALANHNNPYISVCLPTADVRYEVGHVEVFTADVTQKTKMSDMIMFGAYPEGVKYWPLMHWNSQFYTIGLSASSYVWDKWKMKKVARNIDLDAYASMVESYAGKDYALLDCLIAKAAAPNRFSCTTLCWWCAKKLFRIDLSSWYLPLVLPAELYVSEYTYVKSQLD